MVDTRIKISSVVENQLPAFVREDFPLVGEFLSQYYTSVENQGAVLDILQNIDKYIKVEQLTNLTDSTSTTSSIGFSDDTINVVSTSGFPDSYGIIQIDSEIITYTSKTETAFNGCVRGFSGVTSYQDKNKPDHLVFSTSEIVEHDTDSLVLNLSVLFLKEFYKKVKRQLVPGFEDREFDSDLNANLFIKQSKDFYSSKGTDQSFEILFRALYGEDVEVIKPRDYLFIPSDAQYRITKDLVVEALEGNPEDLENRTLYQDQYENFNQAFGSINKIEKIFRGDNEYYVISLDYDYNKDISVRGSVSGEFSVHPQTKIITEASIGSTVLDVDSTVGFPSSGEIVADLENGTSVTISYESKSYTQFYGCSGITQNLSSGQNVRINSYAYGYSGIGTDNVVKLRVTGVLSELKIDDGARYYNPGNKIVIKTLGEDSSDIKSNNWIYNIASKYDIDSISLVDISNFTYQIRVYDNHNFYRGDSVKLILSDGTDINTSILSVLNEKTFTVSGQGIIDITKKDKIQKVLSKGSYTNFPEASNYSTNVQNVYTDQLGSYYVTSPSLPSYLGESLGIRNRGITFSGTFSGENLTIGRHYFYTGDSVIYRPESESNSLNITEGTYYVKRVDPLTIKLSRSRENIYKGNYINLSGTVTNSQLIFGEFAYQTLDTQKLVRKIQNPENTDNSHETKFGQIGILVNGVEILNYKSKDKIFYGPLEEINVLSEGSNYDVINPPTLSITDSVGTGATGYCEVHGQVEKINIIDGGFDYISEPIVTISGGGGSGAKAKAELFSFEHSVSFNAIESSGLVDLTNDTIGFSSYHKFRDAERIIYKPDGQQAVGGISTDSSYYVSVQDSFTVKLHKTYEDAAAGINTINLTSYGTGVHRFASSNIKKKISYINVYDKGSGYKNRKISIPSSGINTASNAIFAKNHNYSTGEIIVYNTTGSVVGGLVDGQSYYVTALDSDSFKLSKVGVASTVGVGSAVVGVTTTVDFYFKSNQYVDLTSVGSGYHQFNYEPIVVNVSGIVGVSTRTNQDFNAIAQPIVRGQIKSVFLESGGSNYGSEEVINFNRQPIFNLNSGTGSEVIPVISNGAISEVLVTNSGREYNSPPSFEIIGNGYGAELTPVIVNGSLSEVKVVYGGVGFETSRTIINVIPAGSGANLQSVPKTWTINLVERNLQSELISDDDGVIDNGINSDYGLQYTHLYAPRKLRRTITTKKLINGTTVFSPDLVIQNNREALSDSHSPIIGWAYDGNPIYGPYGYSTITGGSVKALESGYKVSVESGRPRTSLYPEGFFVEDYQYNASGDLDQYNGRFCVTPEYPNGVYAYFSTINGFSVESSGPLRNYRKPVFPYFIGNEFKSKPIDYNFSTSSNQDSVDLNQVDLLRNTTPYNLLNQRSGYDFIVDPNKIRKQTSVIRNTKKGSLDSIGIVTGGLDYKVNDVVIFNNQGTGGQGASVKVSSVKGKLVNQISVNSTSLSNVEFVPLTGNSSFVAFSTSTHNLLNLDLVKISGISTFGTELNGFYNIGVRSDNFSLNSGIGSTSVTGIVTYFSVSGQLNYPFIRENDVFEIDSEKVKVLNIDQPSGRIRVLREYDGTVGSSHTVASILYEQSRKFTFTVGLTTTLFPYKYNTQIYFNPVESVGLGTTSGVGIGSTLSFSNPGVGVSSLFIPTRSIYLPNHNLNTGDKLVYSSGGDTAISVSTDGSSSFQLIENQIVYAARITNNLIGIATNRVGLGSTGNFVGINSSVFSDILYFTNEGAGVIHSFQTSYDDVIAGKVDKNLVTVSTASTHGLKVKDSVFVDCSSGVSTTYTLKYNEYNRRLVVNPKDFLSGDVNTSTDSITLTSHGYTNGQKVIHTSSSPSGGLVNNGIYYIVVIDDNTFKLAETYYNATLRIPVVIDLISASSGTLSLVNPPIVATKNQSIIFDLSDNSLSYLKNSIRYPAFDFNLYSDENLKNIFETSGFGGFEISRSGTIGVSTTAKLTLSVSNNIPSVIYYGLEAINLDQNDQENLQIIVDNENIQSNNRIDVVDSSYSGIYSISGITTNTFSYNIPIQPERSSYLSTEVKLSYTTNSLSAFGEINDFNIISGGKMYNSLPGISSVYSSTGSGTLLVPSSDSIGNILSTEIKDIGFEYSADKTLRPTAKLPQILKVSALSTFKNIGISSVGKNYTISPNLIVIDSVTNEVIDDVNLSYNIGDSAVTILKNTKGINNKTPLIIPTNNSNGIGINSITFNSVTKDVTVGLAVSYSSISDYPFVVGDKVIIENTSVGTATTLRGYNSSAYNYALFTLTSIDPNIGGANGTITYNLSEYLDENEDPGTFSLTYSSGRVTPEKFFPIFDITLEKNQFFNDELVSSNGAIGTINEWDSLNEILKVLSEDTFEQSQKITASSSGSQAIISFVEEYNALYNTSASSIVRKGWETERGFLNNNFQRIHDSDYYQYFSYSIKSKVDLEKWDGVVDSTNHTAGFKKFSDLVVESSGQDFTGISTEQNLGDFSGIADLVSLTGFNCVSDFDLATERTLTIDSNVVSDEIVLGSATLQDYFESIGNRVLLIDDISEEFNSNPRSTPFSVVDRFRLDSGRIRKFITYVKDRRFTAERQLYLVSILHNDSSVYINQYGRIQTVNNMGSFDVSISGDEGNLLFYPVDYEVNNFNVSYVSYNLEDAIAGIGTTTLGDVVDIQTSNQIIPSGTTGETTLVGIASTYTSSKVLVSIAATDDSYYEFDEISIVHDGTNIEIIDYGQLTDDSSSSYSIVGLGTYGAAFSGSNVNLNFTPYVGVGVSYVINTLRVSIGDTSSTGIGTQVLNTGLLESGYTSIASSTSPVQNTVFEYDNSNYNASYYIVSVNDMTNNATQMSEVVVIDDETQASIVEFGEIFTQSGLGTIGAGITGSNVQLYFTPVANIDVEVRVFQNAVRVVDTDLSDTVIDLESGSIDTGHGEYRGTFTDVKRQFNLTHKQLPIFERNFEGNNSSTVNVSEDTIRIPGHFFVSGEELVYSNAGSGTTQAIGIASTSFVGIGTTDKLPSSVYAIKVDDLNIKLASSAENALKTLPIALDITSVGIGTLHTFTAKNQNAKTLISIDNVIQSPVVSTAVTTSNDLEISTIDDTISLVGITSIFGGDLLKINDEIVRVNSVGFGSTNVLLVERSWMGTGLATHAQYSLVTKVTGNYNIVDNTINFITSPYGPVPIGTSSNTPNQRDWTGITTHSTFSGRTFIRSGVENSTSETYSKNYIFDDISQSFTGIGTEFTLKSNSTDISAISTGNAIILINEIFQVPRQKNISSTVEDQSNYTLVESVGITSVQFTGTATSALYDVNSSNVPVGGIIVSVGSTSGFGYQPLVAAGGTAVVSASGTIQSISIGNSGSGYREGVQTVVNVGVATSSTGTPNIEFIGTAAISGGNIVSVAITNPGVGYTSTNPPIVVFDEPLSYNDIPLIYSSSSVSGFGTEATVDIVVGQGSSVIDFEIKNLGYGYGQGEVLTVSIGGTVGIPTNTSLSFSEFQISIERTDSDSFSGWTIGDLEVFDPIDSLFDGIRVSFPLFFNGEQKSIKAKPGSSIDVQSTLIVFLNDILQVPGQGYIFNGGSNITFTEAPKVGDTCKIVFYKGTGDVDVREVDILETIKIGDLVRLDSEQLSLKQNDRIVTEVVSVDTINTNVYPGPGITQNSNLERPLIWCRQTEDLFIDGKEVSKDRIIYEPLIQPSTNIIQSVGVGSTVIFVESLKTFFDSEKENVTEAFRTKIEIISQDTIVSAAATALVSASGTISSVIISNGGVGYSTNPEVTISNPVGLGSTQRATASANISVGGTVSSISVSSPGTGYTNTNPPVVLIEEPSPTTEEISNVNYSGDFGIVSGISTVSVGVASTGLVFDLIIPENSFLRDSTIVGTGITVSGIQTGYYFVVFNSNVGNGLTSLYSNGSNLSIGSSYIDNVYEVAAVSIAQTDAVGIGLTYVAQVTVSVSDYNGLSGIGYSSFFGEYSWGRIESGSRSTPKSFTLSNNGLVGISTAPIVRRVNPLKYLNYN